MSLPRPKRLLVTGIVGAVAGMLLATVPAAAANGISVSPTSVRVGGTIVISASTLDCPPQIRGTITSSPAALFPPDGFGPSFDRLPSGGGRVSYRVPTATPPGTYTLRVRCLSIDGGVSATLQVTAQVRHVPSGPPQAGLGGASTGGRPTGWLVAGTVAAVLAAALGIAAWQRRRG